MRRLLFFLLILVFAAGAVWLVNSKKQTPESNAVESEEPLLLLDDEPLLLLDDAEPLEDLDPATGPVADNSLCHVCHINYEIEELAVTHARNNIGCAKCHGPSEKHRADEDSVVGPDIMYSMARINASCMAVGCHPRDEIDNPNHKNITDDLAADKTYCTNCHGDHLLSHRTRRWNKDTGELLEDDKVRLYIDQRPEEAE